LEATGRKVHPPGKGSRTRHQQYEVEQRIWIDISNAIYEAGARVAEWIKEGGEKQDKRVWAAVEEIKAYTMAYVTAEKERLKGTEMEDLRGNRAYEMLTTRAQQLSDDLGMTNAIEPSTYAEAAAQRNELYETMESQRERMATMEREYKLKLEVVSGRATLAVMDRVEKYKQEMKQEYDKWLDEEIAAHNTTRKKLATMEREYEARLESMETMKREHETEVEVLKGGVETSHHIYTEAHDTTRKNLATMEARLESMEMMKREHETEVEVLKGRVETSHHIYTEAAVQTEEVLDKTTPLPERTREDIPTR